MRIEDNELNAICDARKDGPFVWVSIDELVPAITTRYVGTIAFQGTDAQMNQAMRKYFGGVK